MLEKEGRTFGDALFLFKTTCMALMASFNAYFSAMRCLGGAVMSEKW